MMDAIGPKNVVAYAKRFGFSQEFPPYLPIALGAGDGTLLEVTSAYTVFPNQGVRMPPFNILKVTDRDGNLLEENRAEPADVIRADTAFVMTNLLRGVVQRGTAASAASIEWPLAGKTGTVDENTDAWFVGFDPYITVGVWVGHDEKRPIGPTRDGRGRRAADLDRVHEGVHRRAAGQGHSARRSKRPATSSSWRWTAPRARSSHPTPRAGSRKPSSPARSRGWGVPLERFRVQGCDDGPGGSTSVAVAEPHEQDPTVAVATR